MSGHKETTRSRIHVRNLVTQQTVVSTSAHLLVKLQNLVLYFRIAMNLGDKKIPTTTRQLGNARIQATSTEFLDPEHQQL